LPAACYRCADAVRRFIFFFILLLLLLLLLYNNKSSFITSSSIIDLRHLLYFFSFLRLQAKIVNILLLQQTTKTTIRTFKI